MTLVSFMQALPALEPREIGEAFVGALLIGKALIDHLSVRRKEARQATTLEQTLDAKLAPIKQDIQDLSGDVRDLHAYVVGPDGENGIRGDVRDIKARIAGLETRERETLKASQVGAYQAPR